MLPRTNWCGESLFPRPGCLAPGPFPRLDLPANRRQNPFVDPYDQAGFFRQMDEVNGRDQSAFGILPAHQCLGTDDMAGGYVYLRLVIDPQLVGSDRVA